MDRLSLQSIDRSGSKLIWRSLEVESCSPSSFFHLIVNCMFATWHALFSRVTIAMVSLSIASDPDALGAVGR